MLKLRNILSSVANESYGFDEYTKKDYMFLDPAQEGMDIEMIELMDAMESMNEENLHPLGMEFNTILNEEVSPFVDFTLGVEYYELMTCLESVSEERGCSIQEVAMGMESFGMEAVSEKLKSAGAAVKKAGVGFINIIKKAIRAIIDFFTTNDYRMKSILKKVHVTHKSLSEYTLKNAEEEMTYEIRMIDELKLSLVAGLNIVIGGKIDPNAFATSISNLTADAEVGTKVVREVLKTYIKPVSVEIANIVKAELKDGDANLKAFYVELEKLNKDIDTIPVSSEFMSIILTVLKSNTFKGMLKDSKLLEKYIRKEIKAEGLKEKAGVLKTETLEILKTIMDAYPEGSIQSAKFKKAWLAINREIDKLASKYSSEHKKDETEVVKENKLILVKLSEIVIIFRQLIGMTYNNMVKAISLIINQAEDIKKK